MRNPDYYDGPDDGEFHHDGYLFDLWDRDAEDRWYSTRKAPTVL